MNLARLVCCAALCATTASAQSNALEASIDGGRKERFKKPANNEKILYQACAPFFEYHPFLVQIHSLKDAKLEFSFVTLTTAVTNPTHHTLDLTKTEEVWGDPTATEDVQVMPSTLYGEEAFAILFLTDTGSSRFPDSGSARGEGTWPPPKQGCGGTPNPSLESIADRVQLGITTDLMKSRIERFGAPQKGDVVNAYAAPFPKAHVYSPYLVTLASVDGAAVEFKFVGRSSGRVTKTMRTATLEPRKDGWPQLPSTLVGSEPYAVLMLHSRFAATNTPDGASARGSGKWPIAGGADRTFEAEPFQDFVKTVVPQPKDVKKLSVDQLIAAKFAYERLTTRLNPKVPRLPR